MKKEVEKSELRAIIRDLNDGFAGKKEYEDINVYEKETLEKIRKIPFPVVVDLNNVLVNGELPLKLNPEARIFLRGLEGLGATPVIVTTTSAQYRKRDIEFLQESELWSDDMVFINLENYQQSDFDNHEEAINDYLEGDFARKNLESFNVESLPIRKRGFNRHDNDRDIGDYVRGSLNDNGGAAKRLAPIFHKEWEVPIIDDWEEATDGNFGMKGFRAIPFESRERIKLENKIAVMPDDKKPNLEDKLKKLSKNEREGRFSLLEILEQIKRYKESMGV